MNRQHGKTCHCQTCDKWFDPLGIAVHRKSHKKRGEDVKITFTNGNTYSWKYSKNEPVA